MKPQKNKTLISIGVLFICYWIWDVFTNAVLVHDFSWLLWYSSVGLLLTGIALIIQNTKLLYSLFCALFVLETLWILDFVFLLFNHVSSLNLTHYLYHDFAIKNIFFVMYHGLMPLTLLFAVIINKKNYAFGWVGAALYAGILGIFTYLFTGNESNVNCLHSLRYCAQAISFFNYLQTPYRLLLGIILLTVVIFIPTNYITLYFKKMNQKEEKTITTVNPLPFIKPIAN